MGWINVQTNSEQNIGQVGNPKTRKDAETTVDSSPLKFRYSRERFWLAHTSPLPLPLPSSEEDAEFVFLGTTTSISLFYSLILIQSSKTWIVPVLVFLVRVCVCVFSHSLLCILKYPVSNSSDARTLLRRRNFLLSCSRYTPQSERKSGTNRYILTNTWNRPNHGACEQTMCACKLGCEEHKKINKKIENNKIRNKYRLFKGGG